MDKVTQRRQRLSEISRRGITVPQSVYGALEQDVPPQQVREWGWWSHIWERPRPSTWTQNASLLPVAQEAWDKSETFVTGQLALAAERETRVAEQVRQREAEDRQQREAEAAELKDQLRKQFLRLPGTAANDFETQYPQLLADHRRRELDRLAREEDEARTAMRRSVMHAMSTESL